MNGQQFAFLLDCSLPSDGPLGLPMTLEGVDEDPLSYFYRKSGSLQLTTNQTSVHYVGRHICYTEESLGVSYVDSNITVTVFQILSVAGYPSIADEQYRYLIHQIRAYQYSTVVYVVEGLGLSDRLQLSLQYECKDNGMLPPNEAETAENLFGTNATRSGAFVRFSHQQTDIPFTSKDVCVSRGSSGLYDFSGFVGNTMKVFSDCMEDSCLEGSCFQPTGDCLCPHGVHQWQICAGDQRNVTPWVNQSLGIASDPLTCRGIKAAHYAPEKVASQYFLINPTQRDRFPVYCDMADGGGWASIPNTYVETQYFTGGEEPQWLTHNVTYNLSLQRMEDIRNLSLYVKQDAIISCQAGYADFSCRRAPYHFIHEAVWLQWDTSRLWPVYAFDGCCFGCCQQSTRPRTTLAQFASPQLPIRNVRTFFAGADDNSEEYQVDMQPVKFH
eukprot:GGOE01001520.1.p1 GENE.GGOE01001520.1~~GGOE01001520.1.p1  ORF type:complete len:519 (+),score=167.60 GGOE01001520.1:233-1558(+)